MEDIFKVVFYAIVVIVWIIYKANEQRKSGMWKKRSDQNPEAAKPQEAVEVLDIPRKILKDKKPVKKASPPSSPKIKEGPSSVKTASYTEPFFETQETSPVFTSQIDTSDLSLPDKEKEDGAFVFDLRQSIIASEILKRPPW